MTSRATESLLVDNTAQPVLPTAPAAIVRISMPCSPSMAANRASIDALMTYALQQKLIPERMPIEQAFFDPEA